MDNRKPNAHTRFIIVLLFAVVILLAVLLSKCRYDHAVKRNDRQAVTDFNAAMQDFDMDSMEDCWDTTFTISEADMPSEDYCEGTWHTWGYYENQIAPYLTNSSLNQKMQENAAYITPEIRETKQTSGGMYYVEVTYSYYSMDWVDCWYEYNDLLLKNNAYDIDECPGYDMDDLLDIWYDCVKEHDLTRPISSDYQSAWAAYLVRDGRIVAYQNYAGSIYHDMENVLVSDFPYIKQMTEEDLYSTIAARRSRKSTDDSQSSQEGSEASGSSSQSSGSGDSDTPAVSGGYVPDASDSSGRSGTSGTDGSGGSGTGAYDSGNADNIDPDDHDIEGYYEDYRDDYEDEDDAYDGFLDDSDAWDDY